MRIYVSGPISASVLSLDEVRAVFVDTCEALADEGHEPINPFDVPPHSGCACPSAQLDDTAGAGGLHTWGCYLRGDLAAMLGCDAIYMLPDWETSHGARLELAVAAAVGLRVLVAGTGHA